MAKKTCSICETEKSEKWHKCGICGAVLCDDCINECDKCKRIYCISKKECGDDFVNDDTPQLCAKCRKK